MQNIEQFKIEKPNLTIPKQTFFIQGILIKRGVPEDVRKKIGQWYNEQIKNVESLENNDMYYMVTRGEDICAFVTIDSIQNETASFSVLTTTEKSLRGLELDGYLAAMDILGRNPEIEKITTKVNVNDEYAIKTLLFLGFESKGNGLFSLDKEPVYQVRGAYKK